jgi:hypothetical protein
MRLDLWAALFPTGQLPTTLPVAGAPQTPRASARHKHYSQIRAQTRLCTLIAVLAFFVVSSTLVVLWEDDVPPSSSSSFFTYAPSSHQTEVPSTSSSVRELRSTRLALVPLPNTLHSALSRAALVEVEPDIHAEAAVASDSPPYYLTACVMVKDAYDAVPEFVARNHLAGVDHFVIMDDSDAVGFEQLRTTIEPIRHLVSLVRVSRSQEVSEYGWTPASQISSSLDCAASLRSRNMTRWIAMIDIDEFFEANAPVVDYGMNTNPDTPFMRLFLEQQEDKPAVCIRWKSVLTNGRVDPAPCGETLSSYYPAVCNVTGAQDGHPLSRRKTVAQAQFLSMDTPLDDSYGHTGFRYLPPHADFYCPNDPAPSQVSIIHYWSMSLVDYVRKIGRGRPRRSFEQRTMFDLLLREQLCDHKMDDPSSVLRDQSVRKFIASAGYRCKEQVDRRAPVGKSVLHESPAIQFMIERYSRGEHFDSALYAQAFQLAFKSVFGGFLSGIDMIPWVHFSLHGYDPQTAAKWFHA